MSGVSAKAECVQSTFLHISDGRVSVKYGGTEYLPWLAEGQEREGKGSSHPLDTCRNSDSSISVRPPLSISHTYKYAQNVGAS